MRLVARGLVVAVVWMAVAAPLAFAHATLVRASPTDGVVLKAQPTVAQLRFNEPVDLGPGSVRLLDANGGAIKTGKATHVGGDQTTAVLKLPPGLKQGTYVVAWRVTSADSHPVSGAFSFSVGQASSFVDASEPGRSGPVVRAADGIFRALAFIGFSLTVGGAFVLLALSGEVSRRGQRVLQVGIGVLLAGTVLVLLLQGPYASGGSLLDAFKPSLLSFSVSTHFGQALVVRLLLALLLAGLLGQILREGRSRGLLVGAAVCVLAMLLTWTLTDHSRTGVQVWLGIPAATLHLLAMALWLGGLAMIAVGAVPDAGIARFSRLALGCFAVLGVTGVYLAYRQSGELGALPATGFGRLLLIKSGVVVVIVGLAYLSRQAVARGRFAGRLRRTVAAEAVLGVGVLGLTAGLVNAAPARVAYAPPLNLTVAGVAGGKVQLHVAPAKQGENVADIYLVQKNGSLLVPPEVTARLKPPKGQDLGALPVDLTAAEPGHYVATAMSVPNPGRWTLALNIRTTDIDEDEINLPLHIR